MIGKLCSHLGMGNYVDERDGVIYTDDARVWCTENNAAKIRMLQRKYGTGAVNYCPHPVFAITVSFIMTVTYEVLIISRENMTIDTKRIAANSTKVRAIYDTHDEFDLVRILHAKGLKYVVISDNIRTFVKYAVIASGVKYATLSGGPLSFLSIPEDELREMRCYLSWIRHCKPFHARAYSDILVHRLSADKLKFTLSPDDYYYSKFWSLIADECYLTSETGGLNFQLNTFSAMNDGIVILHPWFGLVETVNASEVREVCTRKEFAVNISFCLGLFVFTHEIANILSAYDVNVELIEIPRVNCKRKKVRNFALSNPPETFEILDLIPECQRIVLEQSDTVSAVLGNSYYEATDDKYLFDLNASRRPLLELISATSLGKRLTMY